MSTATDPTDIFTVTPTEALLRLDKLLCSHFPTHSRTYFQYLIEQGCVLVNGSPMKKRESPKEGDEVEVCFQLTPEISLEPQDIPLDILYEDEHMIAINKPAQMVVHPAPGHPKDTFVNALLFHCKSLQGTDPLRPGIVHRLDKDTSGILIAAKTAQAHAKLVEIFAFRENRKVLPGCLRRNSQRGADRCPDPAPSYIRKEMAVNFDEGKEAKSLCRVLGKSEHLSLVEVQILTGRTHQIRVHLKHVGTPVLGDPVYGSESANKKLLPSAAASSCPPAQVHPSDNGKELHLTAPLPRDLCPLLRNASAKNL